MPTTENGGRPPRYEAVLGKLLALSEAAEGDLGTAMAALTAASAAVGGRWPELGAVTAQAAALRTARGQRRA